MFITIFLCVAWFPVHKVMSHWMWMCGRGIQSSPGTARVTMIFNIEHTASSCSLGSLDRPSECLISWPSKILIYALWPNLCKFYKQRFGETWGAKSGIKISTSLVHILCFVQSWCGIGQLYHWDCCGYVWREWTVCEWKPNNVWSDDINGGLPVGPVWQQ